ncbi:MAG: hypothetical protein ACK4YM_09625 [Novosphingobium sp.]
MAISLPENPGRKPHHRDQSDPRSGQTGFPVLDGLQGPRDQPFRRHGLFPGFQLEPMFQGKAPPVFTGPLKLAKHGMVFHLPAGGTGRPSLRDFEKIPKWRE